MLRSFFVCGWAWELKRVDDERGLVVLPRPEIAQSPSENQSISGSDHVVDHRCWRHLRLRRRDGGLRHQVDWCTGKHETPHLSSETRSVDRREPATLGHKPIKSTGGPMSSTATLRSHR